MQIRKKKNFRGIRPFPMYIQYTEEIYNPNEASNGAHIHDQCELYVNIAGDVSFMVGDTVYPI